MQFNVIDAYQHPGDEVFAARPDFEAVQSKYEAIGQLSAGSTENAGSCDRDFVVGASDSTASSSPWRILSVLARSIPASTDRQMTATVDETAFDGVAPMNVRTSRRFGPQKVLPPRTQT